MAAVDDSLLCIVLVDKQATTWRGANFILILPILNSPLALQVLKFETT